MTEKVEYGLPQIDMGDWMRGEDKRMGKFVENQVTGFRVYFHYQHPVHDGRLRYIVSKDEFAIGFAVPGAQATDHTGGYRHRPSDKNAVPSVVIDSVGGIFRSDMCTETEHFPVIASWLTTPTKQDVHAAALGACPTRGVVSPPDHPTDLMNRIHSLASTCQSPLTTGRRATSR